MSLFQVHNALDADASSIAVRINIAEGSVQVVDNGCGISQADFKYIGQNYMTSKLVDISTLKSAPNKYGFQGQSLAKLAEISETLKVTSRFYKWEITCEKIFQNGREISTAKCSARPSKGTTVSTYIFFSFIGRCVFPKGSTLYIRWSDDIVALGEHSWPNSDTFTQQ